MGEINSYVRVVKRGKPITLSGGTYQLDLFLCSVPVPRGRSIFRYHTQQMWVSGLLCIYCLVMFIVDVATERPVTAVLWYIQFGFNLCMVSWLDQYWETHQLVKTLRQLEKQTRRSM